MRGSLTLPASAEQLASIRSWVEGFVATFLPDAALRARLLLAVHELSANVIEHAYAGQDAGEITIGLVLTTTQVMVRIDHAGMPFDTAQAKPPTFDGTETRGFGVWLARQASDDIYFFSDGANRHSAFLVHNLISRTATV